MHYARFCKKKVFYRKALKTLKNQRFGRFALRTLRSLRSFYTYTVTVNYKKQQKPFQLKGEEK